MRGSAPVNAAKKRADAAAMRGDLRLGARRGRWREPVEGRAVELELVSSVASRDGSIPSLLLFPFQRWPPGPS